MSTLLPIFGPQAKAYGNVTAYAHQPIVEIQQANFVDRIPVNVDRVYAIGSAIVKNMPSSGVDLYVYVLNDTSSPNAYFMDRVNINVGQASIIYKRDVPNDGQWYCIGTVRNFIPNPNPFTFQFYGKFSTPGTYRLGIGFSVTAPSLGVPRRPMTYVSIPIHVPPFVKNYVIPIALGVVGGALGLYIIEKVRKRI